MTMDGQGKMGICGFMTFQRRTFAEVEEARARRQRSAAAKRELAEVSGVGALPEERPAEPGRLPAQSVKGAAINREYLRLRGPFLEAHRRCEIRVEGCTGAATQVHHLVRRSASRALIADTRNFCATCDHCHTYVGKWVDWAKRVAKWDLTPAEVAGAGDRRFIDLRPELIAKASE